MKKVFVKDRIEFAASLFREYAVVSPSVADVGCRDEALRGVLGGNVDYTGYDIYPVKGTTIYGDLQAGIDTEKVYDFVFALDVLEHTDNIEASTRELQRLCANYLIINLPNELWFLYRIRLMFGRISGKFKIDLSSRDRHRWFFTKENVISFYQSELFSDYDVEVIALYQRSRVMGYLSWVLGMLGAHSLGALSFVLVCKKRG